MKWKHTVEIEVQQTQSTNLTSQDSEEIRLKREQSERN